MSVDPQQTNKGVRKIKELKFISEPSGLKLSSVRSAVFYFGAGSAESWLAHKVFSHIASVNTNEQQQQRQC